MISAILKKLLKPLKYLQISHRQKVYIDFYIPIALALVITSLVYLSPVKIQLMGKDGLVGLVNGLLQILIGFFVASLAAVATFQREGLDKVMVGNAPQLEGKEVTRRQFTCYMFGYLAFMSLTIYFASGIFDLTIDVWRSILGERFQSFKIFAMFSYFVCLINVLLTTLLSLYYLTDRIVRDERSAPLPVDASD